MERIVELGGVDLERDRAHVEHTAAEDPAYVYMDREGRLSEYLDSLRAAGLSADILAGMRVCQDLAVDDPVLFARAEDAHRLSPVRSMRQLLGLLLEDPEARAHVVVWDNGSRAALADMLQQLIYIRHPLDRVQLLLSEDHMGAWRTEELIPAPEGEPEDAARKRQDGMRVCQDLVDAVDAPLDAPRRLGIVGQPGSGRRALAEALLVADSGAAGSGLADGRLRPFGERGRDRLDLVPFFETDADPYGRWSRSGVRGELRRSDAVLYVVDASRPVPEEDVRRIRDVGRLMRGRHPFPSVFVVAQRLESAILDGGQGAPSAVRVLDQTRRRLRLLSDGRLDDMVLFGASAEDYLAAATLRRAADAFGAQLAPLLEDSVRLEADLLPAVSCALAAGLPQEDAAALCELASRSLRAASSLGRQDLRLARLERESGMPYLAACMRLVLDATRRLEIPGRSTLELAAP